MMVYRCTKKGICGKYIGTCSVYTCIKYFLSERISSILSASLCPPLPH